VVKVDGGKRSPAAKGCLARERRTRHRAQDSILPGVEVRRLGGWPIFPGSRFQAAYGCWALP
jgi:hypothetical protein